MVPEKIVATRIVKYQNSPRVQILVKWSNTSLDESTWENYDEIERRYPKFLLEDKEAVKANVLKILKDAYDVEEEDFLSAELEIVPAGKARDMGLDRSMILAYGHDDRVCAYAELEAKGEKVSIEEIERNLAERDLQDQTRKESPLRQAADAVVLDNSAMTIEDELRWFEQKIASLGL